MAESSINETLLSYVYRKNQINVQLIQFQNSKNLALGETADLADWKTAKYQSLRSEYKKIFSLNYGDTSYVDYTQLPEYKEEIEYVDCFYESEQQDLMDWEGCLDGQMQTLTTELSEINSYVDSFKTILSENIKSEFNYAEGV